MMRTYTIESLQILKQWPDELKKAEILKFYALSEINNLHFENAQKVLKMSLASFQRAQSNSYTINNIACIYNYMGYEARHKGEYKKTIPYFKKAIEICKKRQYHQRVTPLLYESRPISLSIRRYRKCQKILLKIKQPSL